MKKIQPTAEYFDLTGLSSYCSTCVSTLRDYIQSGNLPAYKLKGKLLVKKSEFDNWVRTQKYDPNQKLEDIADSVMGELGESNQGLGGHRP